jgi:hypothetical protein
MPDQPTTHAPHVDDSMAAHTESFTRGAPVESRAQEHRMSEPPDDDVEIEAIVDLAADPVGGALGDEERLRRSELAIALRPHAFPGQRDDLLAVAHGEDAPAWVLDALRKLPIDTRFDTPQEVWDALGGHREVREVDVDAVQGHEVEVRAVSTTAERGPTVTPVPTAEPAAPPAETGLGHELLALGACMARLPFALLRRAARIVQARMPVG